MLILFAADVEPTIATLHIDPFTFTEVQLSQQKLTPKTETREKNDSQRQPLCTKLFKEDKPRDISVILKKCWMHQQ